MALHAPTDDVRPHTLYCSLAGRLSQGATPPSNWYVCIVAPAKSFTSSFVSKTAKLTTGSSVPDRDEAPVLRVTMNPPIGMSIPPVARIGPATLPTQKLGDIFKKRSAGSQAREKAKLVEPRGHALRARLAVCSKKPP
jgi:hypothetical protein